MKWAYYAACQLLGAAFFWLPLDWHHGVPHVPPIGLTLVVILCLCRAWTTDAVVPSIKPLPNRPNVDEWLLPVNWLIGDREDGPTGRYAYGPGWVGAYNPTGSTWRAILWQLRNWLNGFQYITWAKWMGAPPIYYREYGNGHSIELGWQQRYGCTVMVCHFW